MFNILCCIIAIPLGIFICLALLCLIAFICLALLMIIDTFIIEPLSLDRSDE